MRTEYAMRTVNVPQCVRQCVNNCFVKESFVSFTQGRMSLVLHLGNMTIFVRHRKLSKLWTSFMSPDFHSQSADRLPLNRQQKHICRKQKLLVRLSPMIKRFLWAPLCMVVLSGCYLLNGLGHLEAHFSLLFCCFVSLSCGFVQHNTISRHPIDSASTKW